MLDTGGATSNSPRRQSNQHCAADTMSLSVKMREVKTN
jgi:hypothetical protein